MVNPRRSQDFARARDFRHSSCKRDVQKCWSTRGRSRALDIALSFLPAHRPPHAPPHPSSLLESGTQQFAPASSAHSADAASAHLEGKQHASSTTATLAGAAAIASSVTPSQSAHPLAARSTASLERFAPPSVSYTQLTLPQTPDESIPTDARPARTTTQNGQEK